MALFVCNGKCEACEEAEKCPVKGEMKSAEKEFLTSRFGKGRFADVLEGYITEMEPDNLIRFADLSLFNLMQLLSIENEENENKKISKELVERKIEALFPEKMRQAIERFRRGDADAQNDPLTKKIVRKLLPELAEKVSLALQGKCGEKCAQCFLKEHCTIRHEATSVR
jgi:hypothetical protein